MLKKTFALLLLFAFSSAFYSQNKLTTKKIVFIDKSELESQNSEIKRIQSAYKLLDASSCFPKYGNEIFQLEQDLRNSSSSKEEKINKENELKNYLKLQREDYSRREKAILQPVFDEISDKVQELENELNIKIFYFDELRFDKKALIFADYDLIITKQFVKYFNDSKSDSSVLKLNIPESRIALMNTETFYDEKTGIKNLGVNLKRYEEIYKIKTEQLSKNELEFADNFLKQMSKVSEEIREFAYNEQYHIIFTSKKDMPSEIQNFEAEEITTKFITYFNNKYPQIKEN